MSEWGWWEWTLTAGFLAVAARFAWWVVKLVEALDDEWTKHG